MGFSTFGEQGSSLRPGTRSRNKAVTSDIAVPGYAVEVPNAFGVGAEYWLTGDANPRLQILAAGLLRGQMPDATQGADIQFLGPPTGAPAGVQGAWSHRGDRLADLGWRNVKHWGAAGSGSGDDRAAIQACIDNNGSPSGTVYFPPGVYMIGSALNIRSNVRLLGAGMYRSTIRMTAAGTGNLIQNFGNGSWSNSTTISNIGVEHLDLDANVAARGGTSGQCIFIRTPNSNVGTQMYIRHNLIRNAPNFLIALQNSSHVEVSNNMCLGDAGGGTRDGISFWGDATFCRIANNVVRNCTDDGVAFNCQRGDGATPTETTINATMRDNVVVGNVIGDNANPGGGGAGIALTGCDRTVVSGNSIFDYVSAGIRMIMFQTQPATGASENVIVGNTILHTDIGGAGAHNGQGIVLAVGDSLYFSGANNTNHGSIARCLIANNMIWNSRGHGIWVMSSANGGTITDVMIEGNNIDGNLASGVDSNSSGILVGGANSPSFGGTRSQHYIAAVTSISDVTIRGNRVCRGAYYGIRLHGITRPTVEHNQVVQNGLSTAAPGISLASCTDAVVHGNRSRNTSGSGQTYGIEFVSVAGTSTCNDNLVAGNATGGILNTTPGGTFYIWDNPGSSVTRNAPPN